LDEAAIAARLAGLDDEGAIDEASVEVDVVVRL
jgi:hypothetical protein